MAQLTKRDKLTDEDIRMDYLVESGWPAKEARKYIKDHPEDLMMGEAMVIASQRFREFANAIYDSQPWSKKLLFKIFIRIKK